MGLTWEQQYLSSLNRVVSLGHDIPNPRTGKKCRTVFDQRFYLDCRTSGAPLPTTRKVGIRKPIAELLGYLRGFQSAAQFRELGTDTWDKNANDTPAWLANPNRKGEDDLGLVYGGIARAWPTPDGGSIDLLTKIYTDLKNGVDDRGEILTFWNPGLFQYGALRPCLYEHAFVLINGVLNIRSTQRSNDSLLGGAVNTFQSYALVRLMAQITGHTAGELVHDNNNYHIYEDQLPVLHEKGQLLREPFPEATLWINPEIRTLEDVLTWVTPDDFKLVGYQSHPGITYPFSV